MTVDTGTRRVASRRGGAFKTIVDAAAALVKLAGAVFALLLAGHVLLTLFSANRENPITRFFVSVADALKLWFGGLFTPDDVRVAVAVNYGLAAVFWITAAALVARVLRAIV
jgi:hypothetical protein